jgi:hypothetical protein
MEQLDHEPKDNLDNLPLLMAAEVPAEVSTYWQVQFATGDDVLITSSIEVRINTKLVEEERFMVLGTVTGSDKVVMVPEIAAQLPCLTSTKSVDLSQLRNELAKAGLILHDADYIFYFTDTQKLTLGPDVAVRQLNQEDAADFVEFQSQCSELDLDNAYVELEHWMVYGLFNDGRLVCTASAYHGENDNMADIGVITLPTERKKNYATRVVRAMSYDICLQHFEPQYRCQRDNKGSISVAQSAGLSLYGTWEALSPDGDTD